MAHLRTQGVSVFPYLHNILIRAPLLQLVMENMSQTMSCLQEHEFMFSWEKSNLYPTQTILYLGVLIDTSWDVFLSPERQEKIQTIFQDVFQRPKVEVMFLKILLGMMVSCQVVFPGSSFHSFHLQRFHFPYQDIIANKRFKLL